MSDQDFEPQVYPKFGWGPLSKRHPQQEAGCFYLAFDLLGIDPPLPIMAVTKVTNGIVEYVPIGGSGVTQLPPLLYNVFVGKNGEDATANGSIEKPFLTVRAAMEYAWQVYVAPWGAQMSVGLLFTRPCVFVAAGTYDEGAVPLVLPPQICVMGEGLNHTRIIGNWEIDNRWTNYVEATAAGAPIDAPTITLSSPVSILLKTGTMITWDGGAVTILSAPTLVGESVLNVIPVHAAILASDSGYYDNDMRSSWINARLFGDIDIDFDPVKSNQGKLFGFGNNFDGNVTISEKLDSVSNSLTMNACEFAGPAVTLRGIPTIFEGCVTPKATKLTLEQLGVGNTFESLGGSLGEIYVATTVAAAPYACKFGHAVRPAATLTLDGAFSTIDADMSSLPLQTGIFFVGGATLDQIVRTNQPNWSGTTRPLTGLFIGLEFFDLNLVRPIWYTGGGWVDATGAPV